jgi:thiol:disulfide interchange protein DsbA
MKEDPMSLRHRFMIAAAALAFSAAGALAQPFSSLNPAQPTEGGGKIEVIEFFWYSCPHCNAFEPKLVSWIKRQGPDVVVKRVPVAFRDDFVPQQRLYYVLEAMGKLDELHHKVFEAIHVQRNPLNREDIIVAFGEKNGLDKAKFQELYNSFSVSTKARRASQLQDAYKIEGVPSLGIAGRFYTDGTMAGTMDRALQVADYLIGEARKGK